MPLSSRGSGGRPSTRSPTMLRRISSVPPADFRPGRSETSSPQRSSASPSGPSTSTSSSPAAIAARIVVTLASAPSGPGMPPRWSVGQHPVAGEAQREELGRDLAEAVADLRVVARRPRRRAAPRRSGRRASRSPRRRARSRRARTSAWSARRPSRRRPAPTSVPGLERDVVEEHLVEVRLAGDLAQRADRHARRRPSARRTSSGPCAWARRRRCARAAGRRWRAGRSSSTPSGPTAATSRPPAAWRASGCRRGRSRRRARRTAGTRPRRRSASGRGGAASGPRCRARSASGRACRRR